MKIERLSENQIRCTLNKADLAEKEIMLTELAYGTDKAKELFRELMEQASIELGFEVDNIPLMIEAIQVNPDCLILIITKVEDPEELDTRFSKFAPSIHDEAEESDNNGLDSMLQSLSEGADEVLDLFKKIHDSALDSKAKDIAPVPSAKKPVAVKSDAAKSSIELTRIFSFNSLNEVTRLAHMLVNHYDGANSLYKNERSSTYMLVVTQSAHTPEEFNKICNMLSEYGSPEKYVAASEAYMEEHFEPIIKDKAVQSLALI